MPFGMPILLILDGDPVSELSSVLTSASFRWAFVIASSIPYAMYLVAYVWESRNVFLGVIPFWKGQSRAFLPGDLGLALVMASCWYFRGEVTVWFLQSPWFALISLAVGGIVYFLATHYAYTPDEYKDAWKSPTKRYHDVVMYWLFSAALVYICLPVYFTVDWSKFWIFQLVGWGVWIAGMVYDFSPAGKKQTPNHHQHPSEWKPIWER